MKIFIKKLQTTISDIIKDINKKIILRNRKLKFEHIFYFICSKIVNNNGYSVTNNKFKIEDISNVSATAFKNRFNKIDYHHFKDFYNKLYDGDMIAEPYEIDEV